MEVQRQIAAEGRDLRFQIQDLKPHYSGLSKKEALLLERLTALAEQINRQWSLSGGNRMEASGERCSASRGAADLFYCS